MKLTLVGPRPRFVRRALGVAACLTVTALAACSGTDGTGTSEPPGSTATDGRGSPQLPKPLAQFTSAEFQTFISGLYFGGSEVADVSVADTALSDEAPPGAELIIEAMSSANDVSLADPGPNGTVIARLRNLRGNDNTFGTQPGVGFEYYIIVERGDGATGAAFQIVELKRAQNPTQQPPVKVSGGTIRRCDPNESAPAYSSARFGGCEHGERSASAQRTSFFGVGTLWAQGRGSAWVSCREGCCELTVVTVALDS